MTELFGMVVFIGFSKQTADMLLANQNESIDGGKGSINHVKWWHLWQHFYETCPSNQFLVAFMVADHNLSIKCIYSILVGNIMFGQTNFWWHLWQQIVICQSNAFTVFWWEIYLCQSNTEATFMAEKCSNDSWEILEQAKITEFQLGNIRVNQNNIVLIYDSE